MAERRRPLFMILVVLVALPLYLVLGLLYLPLLIGEKLPIRRLWWAKTAHPAVDVRQPTATAASSQSHAEPETTHPPALAALGRQRPGS